MIGKEDIEFEAKRAIPMDCNGPSLVMNLKNDIKTELFKCFKSIDNDIVSYILGKIQLGRIHQKFFA